MANGLIHALESEDGLRGYLENQARGLYVEHVPFYSRVRLQGIADPVTAALAAQTIDFFATSQGQTGNGFARPLTAADTALRAGQNTMPAGVAFVGRQIGIMIHPECPDAVKENFDYFSFVRQRRNTNTYDLGSTYLFPAAAFGIQSSSASSSVANATINQSVNGRAGIIDLPPEAWIYLPAKQEIGLSVVTVTPFFVTLDGLTLGANNALTREAQSLVTFVLYGTRFSLPG